MQKYVNSLLLLLVFGMQPAIAIDDDLVIQSDLNFVGAFKVTKVAQPEGSSDYGDGVFTLNPANNSFFISGFEPNNGNTKITIAEYPLPELVNSFNESDLNFTGQPIQAYSSFIDRIPFEVEGEITKDISNLALIGGKLFVTAYDAYKPGGGRENVFVIDTPNDLANSTVKGFIEVQNKNFANGWLTPIPNEFQADLGGDYLMGNARRASVNARWSLGPSAFSFNSADLLAANNGDVVPNIQLQSYPEQFRLWHHLPEPVNNWNFSGGNFYLDPNCPSWIKTDPDSGQVTQNNKNWKPECIYENDVWTEVSRAYYGAIIPGTSTYLSVGRIGGARKGINYKIFPINWGGGTETSASRTSGEAPFDDTDWDSMIWLFDVQNMINHKNGTAESYDAFPYDYGVFDQPFGGLITSADFDPINNHLYVGSKSGNTGTQFISVYEVLFDRPSAISNVSNSLSLSWDAPVTRINGDTLPSNEIAGYEIKSICGRTFDENVHIVQTTNTNYTLSEVYATCRNSVAAYDINGRYSEFVWNGVEPTGRKFAPASGGLR